MTPLQPLIDQTEPGGTLTLPAGEYGPARIRRPITIQAQPGVVIDAQGAREGLRLMDGAHDVTVMGASREERLVIRNAEVYAIQATQGRDLRFRWVETDRAGKSGILTGHVEDTTIQGCYCHHSQTEHGIYVSEQSRGIRLLHNRCEFNARCGIQVNCAPGFGSDIEIRNNICRHNGNAGIQGASLRDSLIADNELEANRQDVVLWDDDQGDNCACHRVDLTRQLGRLNISLNSKDIRRSDGRLPTEEGRGGERRDGERREGGPRESGPDRPRPGRPGGGRRRDRDRND